MNTDITGTANGATTRATTRDRGPVSSGEQMDEAVEYLTCRSTHRTGSTCGIRLGAAGMPMEATRVLKRLRYTDPSHVTVWCTQCQRATEYRTRPVLKAVA